MDLIFRVITAAHAKGTHHRLALDGIAKLSGPDAQRWQRLFLKHAATLVEGSKAPDDKFKDFKNHVLHPRDGFWGGAVAAAQRWYAELVLALAKGDWATAANATGILSHYVTDPTQPFHTAQSEAEASIHRAFECSVSRSYDDLKHIAAADAARTIDIPEGDDWLEQVLQRAASDANAFYEKLIAHYDIRRGVVDPPSGLDIVAQRIIGEQLGLASALFAAVVERAIAEAKATPPDVSLTLDLVLSTLRIPVNTLLKKIADIRERALVERMYDELMATGTVEKNLPADDRAIRDLYATEVLGQSPADAQKTAVTPGSAARLPANGRKPDVPAAKPVLSTSRIPTQTLPPPTSALSRPAPAPSVREVPLDEPVRPAPRAADQAKPLPPVSRYRGEPAENNEPSPVVATNTMPDAAAASPAKPFAHTTRTHPAHSAPVAVAALVAQNDAAPARPHRSPQREASSLATAAAAAASIAGLSSRQSSGPVAPRIHLTPAQDIVDAPTIGPKMAERLSPIGLKTVADLLAAQPDDVAGRLAFQGVTPDTVRDWQDQARLVCTVPGVRGTHAQLLVGAGFRTIDDVATAEPEQFCARVLAYAAGGEGQRLLRHGDPPDVERIKSWVETARHAKAA